MNTLSIILGTVVGGVTIPSVLFFCLKLLRLLKEFYIENRRLSIIDRHLSGSITLVEREMLMKALIGAIDGTEPSSRGTRGKGAMPQLTA